MKTEFKPGDIIIWNDQEFVVLENYGYSGVVKENFEYGDTIRNFRWDAYGEKSMLKTKRP